LFWGADPGVLGLLGVPGVLGLLGELGVVPEPEDVPGLVPGDMPELPLPVLPLEPELITSMRCTCPVEERLART
jgi:hypothetical protein